MTIGDVKNSLEFASLSIYFISCNFSFNKKVLLSERKRYTAHRVSNAPRYAGGGGVPGPRLGWYPVQGQGVPSPRSGGGYPVPGLGGRYPVPGPGGYPIPGLGGRYPIPGQGGGPHPDLVRGVGLRWGTPPDLGMGTPLAEPEMGCPLQPDLGWGTPHLELRWGTPPT